MAKTFHSVFVYLSGKRLVQYAVDILISLLALKLTKMIFMEDEILLRAWHNFEYVFVPVLTLMMLFFFTVNDVYEFRERRLDDTIARTIASLIKGVVLIVALIYIFNWSSSRKMLLVYSSLALLFFLIAHVARWHLYGWTRRNKLHTVLAAKEHEARWIIARINGNPATRYQISSWTDEECDINELLTPDVRAVVFGTCFSQNWVSLLMTACSERGIEVQYLPTVFGVINNGSRMCALDDIMTFAPEPFALGTEQRLAKRAIDIVVALLGLLIFSPIMFAAAIAIKRESPGPIFYRQARVGLRGREFEVLKFRSMRDDAERETGAVFAQEHDARLTRIGAFLRRTRIDEMPQFFNVLRGEMSVVGPRPERRVFVEQYIRSIPLYNVRHGVKPGITGFAQIFGKYNTAAEFKIHFDLYYINRCQRWGVWLTDLSLMLQTVSVFFNQHSAEGTFDLERYKQVKRARCG